MASLFGMIISFLGDVVDAAAICVVLVYGVEGEYFMDFREQTSVWAIQFELMLDECKIKCSGSQQYGCPGLSRDQLEIEAFNESVN